MGYLHLLASVYNTSTQCSHASYYEHDLMGSGWATPGSMLQGPIGVRDRSHTRQASEPLYYISCSIFPFLSINISGQELLTHGNKMFNDLPDYFEIE